MRRIEFVWDERKALTNRRKHAVSFEGASKAFLDPQAVLEYDGVVRGEERWRAIGWTEAFSLLSVAYTTWDEDDGTEVYRIISARPATRAERRIYEEAT